MPKLPTSIRLQNIVGKVGRALFSNVQRKTFQTVSHASEYNISSEGKAWIQGLKRKTSWKFSKPEDVE
jgi:hypothetical protein